MTLEQKIRNAGETGVIRVEYINDDEARIAVLDDYEGVLKCQCVLGGGYTIIRYLNGDKFFLTHEEAFAVEL